MGNLTRMLASKVRDDQVICAVEWGLVFGHLSFVEVVCAGEEKVWSSVRF